MTVAPPGLGAERGTFGRRSSIKLQHITLANAKPPPHFQAAPLALRAARRLHRPTERNTHLPTRTEPPEAWLLRPRIANPFRAPTPRAPRHAGSTRRSRQCKGCIISSPASGPWWTRGTPGFVAGAGAAG